jgi:hypothetical protein
MASAKEIDHFYDNAVRKKRNSVWIPAKFPDKAQKVGHFRTANDADHGASPLACFPSSTVPKQ